MTLKGVDVIQIENTTKTLKDSFTKVTDLHKATFIKIKTYGKRFSAYLKVSKTDPLDMYGVED